MLNKLIKISCIQNSKRYGYLHPHTCTQMYKYTFINAELEFKTSVNNAQQIKKCVSSEMEIKSSIQFFLIAIKIAMKKNCALLGR